MATVRREQPAHPGHPVGANYCAAAHAPASHCSAPRAREHRCHSVDGSSRRLLHHHCPPESPAQSPQHRNHWTTADLLCADTGVTTDLVERERRTCRQPRRRGEQAAHAHTRCAEGPRTAPQAETRADRRNIIPLLPELAVVVLATRTGHRSLPEKSVAGRQRPKWKSPLPGGAPEARGG